MKLGLGLAMGLALGLSIDNVFHYIHTRQVQNSREKYLDTHHFLDIHHHMFLLHSEARIHRTNPIANNIVRFRKLHFLYFQIRNSCKLPDKMGLALGLSLMLALGLSLRLASRLGLPYSN